MSRERINEMVARVERIVHVADVLGVASFKVEPQADDAAPMGFAFIAVHPERAKEAKAAIAALELKWAANPARYE